MNLNGNSKKETNDIHNYDWQADIPDPVLIHEISDSELPIKVILDIGSGYDRLIASVEAMCDLERKHYVAIRIGFYTKHGWTFFHEEDEWSYELDNHRYVDWDPPQALCWFAYMNCASLTRRALAAFGRHQWDEIWKKMAHEMIEYVSVHKVFTS
jgi:hypothetical protein